MKKMEKMRVYKLMTHLIITLFVLTIYAIALFNGMENDTLKTVLTVIIGYWFGAVGEEGLDKHINKRKGGKENEKGK